ncbi:MAG: Asp-tRNA(Asn)/Glu-tRNA(Gln) amidotransferase subunit GatC, partial [Chromatiales bacterium]|nr:Asp-tRNA(Asn)/Glu-tRNA(Gln) amidotransferase subunit GatC [Chromatiales bacterium]
MHHASYWIIGIFPMKIDIFEVHHIARLARLAISEEEAECYAQDLTRILDLADHMNECPTDGVEPLANPLNTKQRLRA